ncbi:MAG TPA: MerR family transcriptional regulator [Paludibacteraceae bacterium]|nr:MerR family transcriptional regulator [Paludibacteraceae bacterium]HPT42325.1 MerR family transcriptional regulator [Paludibacteraceae bacterium]
MEKIYYSISEVATMFSINQSNLRFWEREFKQLKPRRNEKGTRFYSKDDIQLIKQIIFLINDQKLTLDGVKKKLSDKKDVVVKQQEIKERLTAIRDEIKGMIALIDNNK